MEEQWLPEPNTPDGLKQVIAYVAVTLSRRTTPDMVWRSGGSQNPTHPQRLKFDPYVGRSNMQTLSLYMWGGMVWRSIGCLNSMHLASNT